MTSSTSTKQDSSMIVILPPLNSSSSAEERRRVKSLVNSHVGQLGNRGKRLKYTTQSLSRDSLTYNPESYEYVRMHLSLATYRILKKDRTSDQDLEAGESIYRSRKHSLLAPQSSRPVRETGTAICHPNTCNCNTIRPRSTFEFDGFPMNSTLSNLLHITKDWYMSANWPLATGVQSRLYASKIWYETAREAMENPAQLHALLACASSYKARLMSRGNVERSAIITAGIQHKLQSLRLLRQLLEDSKSQLTALQIILCLAAVEFYEGSTDNASMHMKAATGMVNSLGGLQNIDAITRSIFLLGDICVRWWTIEQSSPLITGYDEEDVTTESWIKEMLDHEDSSNITENVQVNVQDQKAIQLDHGLDRALGLANEAIVVRNLGREKTKIDDRSTTRFLLWLHNRRCKLSRICLDGHLNGRHSNQQSCSLESCAYLAIVICHGLIFHHHISILVAHEPLVYFVECLERMLSSYKNVELNFASQPLYFWVVFVGAVIEEIANIYELKKFDWLVTKQFLDLLDSYGLNSIDQIRTELQRFLYSGDELNDYLSVIISKHLRAV